MQTNDPVQGTATVYPAFLRRAPVAALTAAIAMMAAGPAAAFQFEIGPVKGNLDNTVSYGALWRAQGQSDQLIGIANGGTARTVNADDGNLNYKSGDIVNQIFRATHELELKYGDNFGIFVRGSNSSICKWPMNSKSSAAAAVTACRCTGNCSTPLPASAASRLAIAPPTSGSATR